MDAAVVEPRNQVFDSLTGAPIDGATITLIDVATGQPADVFGVDGASTFPATVVSGTDVSDTGNILYDVDTGEFRYPLLEGGEYVIQVDPPEGYTFSSVISPLQASNAATGVVITDASFGDSFTLQPGEPLRFDIPLDPTTDLIVGKTADRSFGDVGDFVNYTVTVQNGGSSSAPVQLQDALPVGFRYVPGTTRIQQVAAADPQEANDASLLTFPMGVIAPGETFSLTYALEIGPGAVLGDAVNRAVVVDNALNPLSNVARATIQIREDLLRSRSTVVGRVAENACDGGEVWARDIRKGEGVGGVRLYMETGAYAITDPNGLFHFEGVTEGTHVVQVDEETLPKGYELMTCEETTRYAGRNSSKFIDVQGGGIWRANFYLRRTGEADIGVTVASAHTNSPEFERFDNEWLTAQTGEIEWLYPSVDVTPTVPSTHIGIKHKPSEKIELTLNGKPVSASHLTARDTNFTRSAMVSRWRGIDLQEGSNAFVATIRNASGDIVKTIRRDVAYVKSIARATAVEDQSVLVADGKTIPEIGIRLEDEAGRPVHFGREVEIDLESPYLLYTDNGEALIQERQDEQIAPLSAQQRVVVGQNGIMRVRLEPTLQTGKVNLTVTLDNGRQIPISMYLEPEKRDWIVVGLAEGTVGYETIADNAVSIGSLADSDVDADTFTDGRVAFFAKGLIKGEWLMTLAVDTEKRRGGRDGDFTQEIDPNAYYTLYGDRSYQSFEALSRYPVFVKLEKKTAYAMFGDFDTNITEGRLTTYNRRFSGLKAEYLGDKFQVLGFAAETNQGFAKDEIAADGTSGTYQLSSGNVLAQSETIVIETRDRFRPDIVLDRRPMVRFLDYTIDYLTGEIIFRLPVDVSDADFNPNVIVADYETSEEVERNITFGGRVQTQLLRGRIKLGSTFVQEDGNALSAGSKQRMVGADVVAKVSKNTELRGEYAITDDLSAGGGTSDAILAEVIHTSERLSAEAYYREEEAGFGLGQRNSNTNGLRRYGATGRYRFQEFENENGRRGSRSIEANAYREENLTTGDQRTTGEVLARHDSHRLSLSAGLRGTRDEFVTRDDRESVLAIARASYKFPKQGLTLRASHEQPLGGQDQVSAHPRRTTLGVDKTLGKRALATIRHEILDGENASGQNTTFGLSATPWKGGTVTASSDLLTSDSGRRLGATVGVDQQVKLSDKWSASAGLRNRRVLDQQGEFVEVAPDAAISPLEENEDFTSAYIGVGYRDDVMSGSARVEARRNADSETYIGSAGIARELSETLSMAGAVRAFVRDADTSSNNVSRVDTRLGAAWRPADNGLIIFDRLDISHEQDETGATQMKFVNNLAANAAVTDRLQISGNYGAKYSRADINGQKEDNFTQLFGAEARFDVTKKIDVGLRGSFLAQDGFDRMSYSFGPSIGFAPVDNVWISVGYNFDGYADDDFEAAEFAREGVYIQFRLKFDQNTASGLLRRISPASHTYNNNVSGRSFARP